MRRPTPAILAAAAALVLGTTACSDSATSPLPAVAEPALSRAAAAAAKPGTQTIVQLAQATPTLSTLVFAIGYSDTNCGTSFGAALSSTDNQFTVFAPTDAAFATLISTLGAPTVLSCNVLPTVLAFHVTPGRHTSTSVLARKSIRMLSGERAAVQGTTIAGAPLDLGNVNISGSNGVVHVVSAVLLPPSILAALN